MLDEVSSQSLYRFVPSPCLGWGLEFGGSEYRFSTVQENWHEARATCQEDTSDLASITSREEQQFIMENTDK